MAITRAQQAKQMLQDGGMLVKPGNGKRPGYRGDAAYGKDSGSEQARSIGQARGQTGPGRTNEAMGDGPKTNAPSQSRISEIRQANITLNRLKEDKEEEKVERFRKLNDPRRKVESFAKKFSPIAAFMTRFGPLNNRDFFLDKVLGSKNFKDLTKQDFANLSLSEQEDIYDKYMSGRLSGETDAYGNPIIRDNGGGGINQLIPVDTTFAQAPSITDQESTETTEQDDGLKLRFRAEGGPIGGEYDFESARQMYGLGKLVKKVTKTVKKIAKSPIGKAAILGAAGFGIPGTNFGGLFGRAAFGGEATGFLGTKGIGAFFGKGSFNPLKRIVGVDKDVALSPFGKLFSKIPGGAVTAGIVGASALAGFLTPEEEAEAQRISDETGIDIAEIRANPNKYLARRFRAEGGSMKEPVAKKTMPLLDMGGKEMDLREDGGFVPIGRMEKADDVPARLSKNEFVFTADAVRNAGDGDVDKGAEVMYNMMKNLEAGGDVSEESQGLEGARRMFQTSQRLEEVI
jgi:hypothetical protein